MLPGVCQGIVTAVVLKNGPYDNDGFWKSNYESTVMASAERAFLNTLDKLSPWKGRPPLAGQLECIDSTATTDEQQWTFSGLLARPDGTEVLRAQEHLKQLSSDDDKTNMSATAKERAKALGLQVGQALLEEAGSHFFD